MNDRLLTDEEMIEAIWGMGTMLESKGMIPEEGISQKQRFEAIAKAQDALSIHMERQAIGEWLDGTCEDVKEPRWHCHACCDILVTALKQGEMPE